MTLPEALPLVRQVYERHSEGCCLHLVLSYGNLEDSSVAVCLEAAQDACKDAPDEHYACLRLALALVDMTVSQRARLGRALEGPQTDALERRRASSSKVLAPLTGRR